MAPADRPPVLTAGLTVHMAGRLTAPVMSFLLPALQMMRGSGTPLALVYVADEFGAHATQGLPAEVARVAVSDSASAWHRSAALSQALREVALKSPVAALHLHGLLPGLAAVRWLRGSRNRPGEVVFVPHGSRALSKPAPIRLLAGRLLELGLGRVNKHAIVSLQTEASLLEPFRDTPVQVVESPVPAAFFDVPRNEAKRPLLVSCNLEGLPAAVDRYVRIAVLLNDDGLGMGFNWVGHAQPKAAAALRAAGIGQFEVDSDERRALRLSTAWIYVAPTEDHGFPVRLVEAMAAGLPCVALDTAVHRSVLADGITGFLCRDLRDFLQRIAELVDAPERRRAMGLSARLAARDRFSEAVFQRHLMAAMAKPPQAGEDRK